MKSEKYCYNINDLIVVQSNYASYVPNYFLSSTGCKDPDLILELSRTGISDVALRDIRQMAPGLYYSPQEELVISTITLAGLKATVSLCKLTREPTRLCISNTYRLFSKTLLTLPISTVFPDHALVQMVLHIKLLLRGYSFLCSACFEVGEREEAVLLSAMGEMGKTSTMLTALRKFKAKYLSDDMVIIGESGAVYPYPKPIRIRLLRMEPLSIEKYMDPCKAAGLKGKISKRSRAKIVCLLERGEKDEIEPVDYTRLAPKLLSITRKLLPYHAERTLLAYQYACTQFELDRLMLTERSILNAFLKDTNCYILRSRWNGYESYVNMLKRIIDAHG